MSHTRLSRFKFLNVFEVVECQPPAATVQQNHCRDQQSGRKSAKRHHPRSSISVLEGRVPPLVAGRGAKAGEQLNPGSPRLCQIFSQRFHNRTSPHFLGSKFPFKPAWKPNHDPPLQKRICLSARFNLSRAFFLFRSESPAKTIGHGSEFQVTCRSNQGLLMFTDLFIRPTHSDLARPPSTCSARLTAARCDARLRAQPCRTAAAKRRQGGSRRWALRRGDGTNHGWVKDLGLDR